MGSSFSKCTRFQTAVLGSLLLHCVVLILVYILVLSSSKISPNENIIEKSLALTLTKMKIQPVLKNPLQQKEITSQEIEELSGSRVDRKVENRVENRVEQNSVESYVTSDVVKVEELPLNNDDSFEEILSITDSILIQEIEFNALKESDSADVQSRNDNIPPSFNGISPGLLSSSISSFLLGYKVDLNQEWLEDCLKYKNRYGSQDCPKGDSFAYEVNADEQKLMSELVAATVTRERGRVRESKELLESMDSLRALMQEGSVTGELAKERYYMDRNSYVLLNSESSKGEFSSTMLNATANSPMVELFGFGGGKVKLLGGLISLNLKESVKLLKPSSDESTGSVFLPFDNSQNSTAIESSLDNDIEKKSVDDFQVGTPLLLSK